MPSRKAQSPWRLLFVLELLDERFDADGERCADARDDEDPVVAVRSDRKHRKQAQEEEEPEAVDGRAFAP